MTKRFIQLSEVSEVLDISAAQAYALVRSGELPAIKVGGRGQWRVEVSELETYIQRMYDETRTFVASHPFGQSPEWQQVSTGRPGRGSAPSLSLTGGLRSRGRTDARPPRRNGTTAPASPRDVLRSPRLVGRMLTQVEAVRAHGVDGPGGRHAGHVLDGDHGTVAAQAAQRVPQPEPLPHRAATSRTLREAGDAAAAASGTSTGRRSSEEQPVLADVGDGTT